MRFASEKERKKDYYNLSKEKLNKRCKECNKLISIKATFSKSCCQKGGRNYQFGRKYEKTTNWAGGRNKNTDGYILIYKPEHPSYKKNYVPEHRLNMEEKIGRYLIDEEIVHHINGIRDDNRIENLELWSTNHPKGQKVEDKIKWCINFLKKYSKLDFKLMKVTNPEFLENKK